MHRKFRDYEKGTEEIIRRLGLDSNSTVIDLGSGTGAFALNAAKKIKTIYAVDISEAMLDYCRQQAEKEGLNNIIFCPGGLLTYEHSGEPVHCGPSSSPGFLEACRPETGLRDAQAWREIPAV